MNSKYQSEWSHKYSMKCSGRGETFAYCSVCNVDFSVAGGGVFQVKHHCQSKKHSSRAKELNHHVKIDSLVTHQAQDQVTRAELYFARVHQVTAASVIRLLKQFNNNSIYDVDAILMEFREYKSLPDSQLPIIASKYALEGFWSAIGELPL